MKRYCLALAMLMFVGAAGLPLAGSAEEEDVSCEIACYEAEEACDARCEQQGDEDLCGDQCEAAFDRCMERCDQGTSDER